VRPGGVENAKSPKSAHARAVCRINSCLLIDGVATLFSTTTISSLNTAPLSLYPPQSQALFPQIPCKARVLKQPRDFMPLVSISKCAASHSSSIPCSSSTGQEPALQCHLKILPLQYVKNNQYFSSAAQFLAVAGVRSGDIHKLLAGIAEDVGSTNLLLQLRCMCLSCRVRQTMISPPH
jgi:hypothetical protein